MCLAYELDMHPFKLPSLQAVGSSASCVHLRRSLQLPPT